MTDPQILKAIGARIRSARLSAGLTQTQLAERALTSKSSVCTWELGNCDLGVCNLTRVAEATGVTAAYLLGGETGDGH